MGQGGEVRGHQGGLIPEFHYSFGGTDETSPPQIFAFGR